MPDFLDTIKKTIADNEDFSKHGITVENYIVSTGLRQMIMGSRVAKHADGVWGCELIESFAEPGFLSGEERRSETGKEVIRGIGYSIDNTTKTRALSEINKGSNKLAYIDVNATVAPEDRRVPFHNMIYIADGPSDVPAFSIVNQYGGRTLAVYKPKSIDQFRAVVRLRKENRVQGIGEASYVTGSLTAMWIGNAVYEIATQIVADRNGLFKERVGSVPQHTLSDMPEQSPKKPPLPTASTAVVAELKRTGTEGGV